MKNRNLTLLTDYYELTMMYGYFQKNIPGFRFTGHTTLIPVSNI